MERNVRKAQAKNSLKAFAKLTEEVDGEVRIRNDPPIVERMQTLLPGLGAAEFEERMRDWLDLYSQSLPPDRRHTLAGFRLVDVARKVVGVGSVGTRCWIALMLGRDGSDPLFLQVKEAEASVLEPYLGQSATAPMASESSPASG